MLNLSNHMIAGVFIGICLRYLNISLILLNHIGQPGSFKETVENPRGSVEGVQGAATVPRGSVRTPKGFSKGKPKAAKPKGHSPRGFAAEGLLEENPKGALTLPRSAVLSPKALS